MSKRAIKSSTKRSTSRFRSTQSSFCRDSTPFFTKRLIRSARTRNWATNFRSKFLCIRKRMTRWIKTLRTISRTWTGWSKRETSSGKIRLTCTMGRRKLRSSSRFTRLLRANESTNSRRITRRSRKRIARIWTKSLSWKSRRRCWIWRRRKISYEFRSWSRGRASLTVASKLAKIAIESTVRRKILTGPARCISQTMAVKCGGVAVKLAKTLKAANVWSMRVKKTRMTMIRKAMTRRNSNSRRTCAVSAAKKRVTQLWIVREIRTCEQASPPITTSNESRK